jgi:hypothetical protein
MRDVCVLYRLQSPSMPAEVNRESTDFVVRRPKLNKRDRCSPKESAFAILGSFERALVIAGINLYRDGTDVLTREETRALANRDARRRAVLVAHGLNPALLQEEPKLRRAFDVLGRVECFFLKSHERGSQSFMLMKVREERANVRLKAMLAAAERHAGAAKAMLELSNTV